MDDSAESSKPDTSPSMVPNPAPYKDEKSTDTDTNQNDSSSNKEPSGLSPLMKALAQLLNAFNTPNTHSPGVSDGGISARTALACAMVLEEAERLAKVRQSRPTPQNSQASPGNDQQQAGNTNQPGSTNQSGNSPSPPQSQRDKDLELFGYSKDGPQPSANNIKKDFKSMSVNGAHPDKGGDTEKFQELSNARDRLLNDYELNNNEDLPAEQTTAGKIKAEKDAAREQATNEQNTAHNDERDQADNKADDEKEIEQELNEESNIQNERVEEELESTSENDVDNQYELNDIDEDQPYELNDIDEDEPYELNDIDEDEDEEELEKSPENSKDSFEGEHDLEAVNGEKMSSISHATQNYDNITPQDDVAPVTKQDDNVAGARTPSAVFADKDSSSFDQSMAASCLVTDPGNQGQSSADLSTGRYTNSTDQNMALHHGRESQQAGQEERMMMRSSIQREQENNAPEVSPSSGPGLSAGAGG